MLTNDDIKPSELEQGGGETDAIMGGGLSNSHPEAELLPTRRQRETMVG